MAYETSVAIRNNVALNDSTWVDIGGSAGGAYAIPISCNLIVVINTSGVPIELATDPGNAASVVTIPAGASWALGIASWGVRLGGPPSGARFRSGLHDAAGSLKSTSGNVNGTLEFVL